MKISDWPEAERPRAKLLRRGSGALSDAELLAILLRSGTRGLSVVDLARQLLNQFGSLGKLLAADHATLCQQPGLGEAKYAQLQAAVELSQRVLYDEMAEENSLSNPVKVRYYLLSKLGYRARETFACLYLNSQYQVLVYEELFHGTINQAEVYPRELVKQALAHNSAAVILAHNHPSGSPNPSKADINLTQQLKRALSLVDIKLVDHLVIGCGRSCSFVELGLL